MSRPRENARKILKKFSANAIFKKLFFKFFFLNKGPIFWHGSSENFRSWRTNKPLEALWGNFGDFDFRPESPQRVPNRNKRFQVFLENCVGEKFFENFSWVFPRFSRRFTYRLSNSVIISVSSKKNSPIDFSFKKNSFRLKKTITV